MKILTMDRHSKLKKKLMDQLKVSTTDDRMLSIARRLVILANTLNTQNRVRHGSNSKVIAMPSLQEIKEHVSKLNRET